MILLSLIVALLLEQLSPPTLRQRLRDGIAAYAHFFQHHFNAGEHRHGRIAWTLAMLAPLVIVGASFWALREMHPVLSWLWCVLVLYLTIGFRQVSQRFTDIYRALRDGEQERARALLAEWRGMPSHEFNEEEIVRVATENVLLAAHRRVFGVIIWFTVGMMLGLGPTGAVLYCLSSFLQKSWGEDDGGGFGRFAHQAGYWIEWMPVRLTAFTFAVVGDFEDAAYCWRTQAQNWPNPEDGILLAAGAGALGVRLGQPIQQDGLLLDRPELGTGDAVDIDFMQSAEGLIWRALLCWLLLLLVFGLVNLASG
ncbi:MAG: CobD/CbiB family protein [Gallionellaceae bacterium]|jgi:cobalamin biosynthesis protein CobD/CbiB|nr:CobD/CbiB family protein [Gallionellaceae bacterium]